MSNSYQEAFENLQRLAPMLKGIIGLAEPLRDIASLENATLEARARLAQAQDEIKTGLESAARQREADQAELARDRAALAGERDQLATDRKNVSAKADQIADRATRDAADKLAAADVVLEQAKTQAAGILAEARVDGAHIVTAAEASIADLERGIAGAKTELDDLGGKIGAAKKALAGINTQIGDKQAVLDEIEQRHRAFLASIGAKA